MRISAILALSLILMAMTPGLAAADHGDAKEGPGVDVFGCGGLIDSVTPDFLADLMKSLPVPDFVAKSFGAGCSSSSS